MKRLQTHPKTISHRSNLLTSQLGLHFCQDRLDDGLDPRWQVTWWTLQPGHEIKVCWTIQRDGISVEQIGHDDQVAISGQLVCDQLGIDEAMANDVGEEEDGASGGFVGWVDEVCFDYGGERER